VSGFDAPWPSKRAA
jgi:hypothetical protein